MSTPDFDKSQVDPDQMFDFLHEDAANKPARGKKSRSRKDIVMPIIRTPVPVSESGPARVGGTALDTDVEEDDLDFLKQSPASSASVTNDQDEAWNEGVHVSYADTDRSLLKKIALPLTGVLLLVGAATIYKLFFQPTGTEAAAGIETSTTTASATGAAAETQTGNAPSSLFSRFNEQLDLIEALLANGKLDEAAQAISSMDKAVYGYGVAEFTELERRIAQLRAATAPAVVGTESVAEATKAAELAREAQAQRVADAEKAADAQRLIDEARDAERARLAADAKAAEQARIAEAAQIAEQARIAEAAAVAEQARIAEAARVAEQARLAEAATVAEQARLAEAARVAEQARLAEAARVAEQARLAEAARVAEQARLADAARVAEQARLAEAAKLAEQARIAKEAEQVRLAEAQRVAEAKRLAEAEQQAVAQRQAEAARAAAIQATKAAAALAAEQAKAAQNSLALATAKAQQRIDQEAETERRVAERNRLNRERAAAAEFARTQAREKEAERLRAEQAKAKLLITPKPNLASISDDDFNFVAGKFVELKQAVTNRDINSVIALTQPSGKRIQQMLQIFENSSSVRARISNVATRNADGVIVGQLKIEKLVKNSGAVATVPANLSSITLTSKRGPNGWSVIAW